MNGQASNLQITWPKKDKQWKLIRLLNQSRVKMCNNALSRLVTGYRNSACDGQMEIIILTKDIWWGLMSLKDVHLSSVLSLFINNHWTMFKLYTLIMSFAKIITQMTLSAWLSSQVCMHHNTAQPLPPGSRGPGPGWGYPRCWHSQPQPSPASGPGLASLWPPDPASAPGPGWRLTWDSDTIR